MLGTLLAGDARLDKLAWDPLVATLEKRGLAASFHHDEDEYDAHWDDDDRDSRPWIEAVKAIAVRVTLSPSAFAWYSRGEHDAESAPGLLRTVADALSAEKVATLRLVVADKQRHVIVLVPWADRAPAVAAAKAAGQRIIPLGPQKPRAKPPRPAKALPVTVKHMSAQWGYNVDDNARLDSLVMTTLKYRTERLDFSTWPPKRSLVVPYSASPIAFHPDGGFVASGFDSEKDVQFLERRSAKGVVTPLEWPGTAKTMAIDRLGFLDEDIVLYPKDWCYRNKHVARPLICRAGKRAFTEISELPPAKVVPWSRDKPCEFERQGFARTGDGDAVMLWNHGGYVRKGKQLVERFELPKGKPVWRKVTTAPAAGDAFFALVDEVKIFEIRAGEKPLQRMHGFTDAHAIAPGPDGAILVWITRHEPKLPVLVAWWPERHEYAGVTATVFGYGKAKSVWFQDHGYAAESGLVWGYHVVGHEIRAVAWDAIAALPRSPEP